MGSLKCKWPFLAAGVGIKRAWVPKNILKSHLALVTSLKLFQRLWLCAVKQFVGNSTEYSYLLSQEIDTTEIVEIVKYAQEDFRIVRHSQGHFETARDCLVNRGRNPKRSVYFQALLTFLENWVIRNCYSQGCQPEHILFLSQKGVLLLF